MNLSGNPLLDYPAAFLGGVAVSFTPCVFPLIPVVAAYIGIKTQRPRYRGLLLSFAYVTGVAVTYSLLGLLASLGGRLFGAVSSHPVAYIIVGAVIVLLGLSMFEAFPLRFPQVARLSVGGKRGYFGVFILGLSSGLILGPCTAPALGAILLYLATRRNVLYGTTLLLAFAYGMGFLLLLAGAFGSFLTALPRSGRWLMYVKKVCAFILMAAGAAFIWSGIRRF